MVKNTVRFISALLSSQIGILEYFCRRFKYGYINSNPSRFSIFVCESIMATSLAETLDESILKCGICLDNYTNPRGLPCLHSFCKECLVGWAKKSGKKGFLTCPNCMQEARIPKKGVKGFPVHFLVNSLQETVDKEKKVSALNSMINNNVDVSYIYLLCKEKKP